MPKYEYTCMNCDTTIEIDRSIHATEEVPICENCGYKMNRSYSTFGITFKGGGFYKTGG